MNSKLEKNRNRYTGDNFEPARKVQGDQKQSGPNPNLRYCIEIRTGARNKIKLSFLYASMRKDLLEKLGQATEEMEIRLFTETEGL